ncbi:hypothetical protein N7537_006924 [Penicillium hordei]|uniref:Hsp70 protein n=1 Tax=Penicillium hordei TaxID=40994 RepID=A0AAD6H3J7_9EURO|nr:uncharacterized protein N7537_006924 [Penicillium hordei]KAJ5603968.1 hypothetical protein N7537_006924 [Penicillium hordei]
MSTNRMDFEDHDWDEDGGSYSDSSEPDLDGLNLTEKDDVLVIGIDFGTTFSGVAYATESEFLAKNISVISEWPGCGRDEGKAPTELLYEHENSWWGYDLPDVGDPIRWFKLLLLNNEDLQEGVKSSAFYLATKEKVQRENLKPVDLVADYLRFQWKHALEVIEKSRGDQFLPFLRFHIMITVPAIWKGYARQSMQEAAEKAGIMAPRDIGKTRLSFVLEPEAAAMATLTDPEHQSLVKSGKMWLILDAGGGTVEPYVVGGALCGGVLIDECFQQLCKNRLGRRWSHLSPNGIKEIMGDKWEKKYKREFVPKQSKEEYPVPIPAEAYKGGDKDLMEALAESFARIDELVDEQISKTKLTLQGIILVGGLGSSPYLHRHLKERYSKARLNVIKSTGMKPRTAICRGAVYKGFAQDQSMGAEDDDDDFRPQRVAPITVTSTISRYSLGMPHYQKFDPSVHSKSEPDYKWHDDEGAFIIDNRVTWYIRKGESVSKIDPVRHSWARLLKKSFQGSFTERLVQCDSSDPPHRCDDAVKPSCDLKVAIDVNISKLKDFTSADGKKQNKKLFYDVEMVPSGAAMEFNFYIDGIKQASHNIKAEYD